MSFGPQWSKACVSYIATPLRAFAPITTSPNFSLATQTPVYEYTPLATPLASATSSIVTITAGLAVADPVVVAWQADDIHLFPSEYQTSLAQQIGVPLPTSAPSSIPRNANSLSTTAKAGIGVGAVLVAAIIGILTVVLRIRRRRKSASAEQGPIIPEMEDQDQNNAQHKWFSGGKWRNEVHAEAVNEVQADAVQNELDSTTVQNELDSRNIYVVPGSPVELDGAVSHLNTGRRDVVEDGS
jgi:hypothetical protein